MGRTIPGAIAPVKFPCNAFCVGGARGPGVAWRRNRVTMPMDGVAGSLVGTPRYRAAMALKRECRRLGHPRRGDADWQTASTGGWRNKRVHRPNANVQSSRRAAGARDSGPGRSCSAPLRAAPWGGTPREPAGVRCLTIWARAGAWGGRSPEPLRSRMLGLRPSTT